MKKLFVSLFVLVAIVASTLSFVFAASNDPGTADYRSAVEQRIQSLDFYVQGIEAGELGKMPGWEDDKMWLEARIVDYGGVLALIDTNAPQEEIGEAYNAAQAAVSVHYKVTYGWSNAYLVAFILDRADTIIRKIEDRTDLLEELGFDVSEIGELTADLVIDVDGTKLKLQSSFHSNLTSLLNKIEEFDVRYEGAFIKEDFSLNLSMLIPDELTELAGLYAEGVTELKIIRDEVNDEKETIIEITKKVNVYAEGQGSITAMGDGIAIIAGSTKTFEDGKFWIKGGGILTITDHNGDAEIVAEGFGEVSVDEGPPAVRVYDGMGELTLYGSNIEVEFDGSAIELTAKGTGYAILDGHGTCELGNGKPCNWNNQKVEL